MKSRVLSSSLVVDFLDVGFDSDKINYIIKSETDKIIHSVSNVELNDWEIKFSFNYNYVNYILIYTKERSYPNEKFKEITIHIPIPTKDIALWGVDKEQHIYENANHLDHLLKNFECLEVDFSQFKNRADYLLDCMRRAIKFCFEKGFTINGVKVKTTHNDNM